jgi:hypothetical protein
MRKIVIHNHLPRARDAKDADINYSIVMKGYMLRHGGQTYGPFKSEGEAQAKKKSLSPGGGHDSIRRVNFHG